MTKDQTAKLRAWVIARARAYVSGSASYDDTCFTTDAAAAHVGGVHVLLASHALDRLGSEGLVTWNRPSATPGYWMPTAAAARAEGGPS